jgi:iron(III) transport system permease protein
MKLPDTAGRVTGKIRNIPGKSVLLYAAVGFLFLFPILRLLVMSVSDDRGGWTAAYYIQMIHDGRAVQAVWNTLWISLCASFISTAGGLFTAFLTAYTNIRFKKFIEILVVMPFVIPSYVITLSWTGLCSAGGGLNLFLKEAGLPVIDLYSAGGIIAMLGICHMSLVYIGAVHMLRKIPAESEWAARASGCTAWQVLGTVDLRQIMPAAAGGAVLAFLSDIDNFAVPAFLGISSGIPVLSTYIYEKVISFGPDSFTYSAALAVVLAGIAAAGTGLESVCSRRGKVTDSRRENRSVRLFLHPAARRITEWGCAAVLTCFSLVPLAYMAFSALLGSYVFSFSSARLSADNYLFVLTDDGIRNAFSNSFFMSLSAALICLFTGTAAAYLKLRRPSAAISFLEKCAGMTYSIPGIVLALSLAFYWSRPLPGIHTELYGTHSLLIIGYVTRYMILQIKNSESALLSVDPSVEEAARASGCSGILLWKKIMMPLLAAPVLAGTFLVFLSALTELTMSSVLSSVSTKTIGLAIFNLQQAGEYGAAAAVSAVILLLMAAAGGFYFLISSCHAGRR